MQYWKEWAYNHSKGFGGSFRDGSSGSKRAGGKTGLQGKVGRPEPGQNTARRLGQKDQ